MNLPSIRTRLSVFLKSLGKPELKEQTTINKHDRLAYAIQRKAQLSRDMTNPTKWVCAQRRPVWSESSLSARRKLGSLATHWAQAKTLIRLGGCPGWSESSLGAQSLCWFCHEAAQFAVKKYCRAVKIIRLSLSIRNALQNASRLDIYWRERICNIFKWTGPWENVSYANNKGADQPAHPRSLISAFVVRCLDSIIPLDSIAEISWL